MLMPDLNERCGPRRCFQDQILVVVIDLGIGVQHGLPG